MIYEDDAGRADVGTSAAKKLITKDKVVMLGFGYSSSVTYAVAEAVARAGYCDRGSKVSE